MAFIVNPASLSFSEIKNDLMAYINSAPDSARWQDFFASSTGTIVVDIIAALGTYLSYNNIVARRENYLRYAINRSSVIAMAETLGYSASRGYNVRISLSVVPNTSGLFSKFTSVGTVKDEFLILADNVVMNEGVPTTFTIIVGTIFEQSLIVQSTDPAIFRFDQPLVSEDIELYLNDNQVEISNRISDLFKEKFVVQSNVFDSVDVLYLNLNNFTTRLNISDVLKLKWIRLKDISFTLSDINFLYGTVSGYTIESPYTAPESTSSIRVTAPAFNETQFLVRGRADYQKLLRTLETSLVDTNYIDKSPAIIELVYVKNDFSILLISKKDELIDELSVYRPMGIPSPTFTDPTIVFLPLKITVSLSKAAVDITTQISDILNTYQGKLGTEISFLDLEGLIESLDFIKIARAAFNTKSYEVDCIYRRGDIVQMGNLLYECVGFTHKSCGTEPSWTANVGDRIEDCRLIWEVRNRDLCDPDLPPHWQPNTDYKIGDVVRASYYDPNLDTKEFVVIEYKNFSSSPTFAFKVTSYGKFTAINSGPNGNSIKLIFDGIKDVGTVVSDWNTNNPTNQVSFDGSPSYVPQASEVQLEGGSTGEPTWTFGQIPCP